MLVNEYRDQSKSLLMTSEENDSTHSTATAGLSIVEEQHVQVGNIEDIMSSPHFPTMIRLGMLSVLLGLGLC
jgi:hypothetical protein